MKKKTQTGFTIVELMITLAVAAVLTVIAYPNLDEMIRNNRISAQANELIGAVNLARSEAIKRAIQANVCASNTDQTACSNNWANGWIVYLDDATGAGTTDGTLDANDTILRVRSPLKGNNSLTADSSQLSYRPSGFSVASRTFVLCDQRGNAFGRVINISSTGRANTRKTTNQCP